MLILSSVLHTHLNYVIDAKTQSIEKTEDDVWVAKFSNLSGKTLNSFEDYISDITISSKKRLILLSKNRYNLHIRAVNRLLIQEAPARDKIRCRSFFLFVYDCLYFIYGIGKRRLRRLILIGVIKPLAHQRIKTGEGLQVRLESYKEITL